jgi:membrane protein implicated in regulation of membrane protease activity
MDLAMQISIVLIVLAVLLFLAEALSPGFFLIIPATVLVVLGFIGLIWPEVLFSWWSPIIAFALLIPMTYLTIKIYQRLAPPGPPETSVATSMVGREGLVIETVKPNSLKGKVRIQNDTWSATSDHEIPKGTWVIVFESEGVHVKVKEKEKTSE